MDPAGPAFQLTQGDVYDFSGARAVVYNGILHVFFVRRFGGLTAIYQLTYDGTSWSGETEVTPDGYNDARPAVTVFNNLIYLFYDGGGWYRTFDGSTRSGEYVLNTHYLYGRTPAAETYGGSLYLFFRYGVTGVYCKRFDGSGWTAAKAASLNAPNEVRDLGCAGDDGELHLLWASWFSWPDCDIFVKRAIDPAACDCPHQCDFDEDTFVTSVDLSTLIDIIFNGAADSQDFNCPATRGDFNDDGFSDSVDLSELIDHVFFGGIPPYNPCAPAP